MLKPGNIERGVIAVVAFLMIASGVGTFVSFGLREAAGAGYMSNPVGYICGTHAFAIIVPGFLGLFVVLGCGCCNKRPAYVTSLVLDILGLLAYIGTIILFSAIFKMSPYNAAPPLDCTYIRGQCDCTERRDWHPYYGRRSDFDNGCDRINMFYASRTALFCMWAFGLLFTIIHLVLVARLSCMLRSGTPGQVLNVPGQHSIPMQTLVIQNPAPISGSPTASSNGQPVTTPIQGRAQVYAVPTSASVDQPQTSSIHGAAPVGAPSTGALTDQPPPYSVQAPVQVGEAQASSLTAQPQPSSKSAAPPV